MQRRGNLPGTLSSLYLCSTLIIAWHRVKPKVQKLPTNHAKIIHLITMSYRSYNTLLTGWKILMRKSQIRVEHQPILAILRAAGAFLVVNQYLI
jgi:hypothetical protein